jgi:O-acetyl-ADP-ribose deacetylase (regulator of RNase III)
VSIHHYNAWKFVSLERVYVTNYVGFLALANITDQALQVVANYLKPRQAHIVCRHEDIPIIDRLYSLLDEDHPGYINTYIDAEDSDTRVVQSCDSLFIYWDGSDRRNRIASEIKERPETSYLLLPSGTMIHLHEQYSSENNSERSLEKWIYRPEAVVSTLSTNQSEAWNGLFTNKYFFLSSLSNLPTYTDDGFIYPSLLHALIACSIQDPLYLDFFNSSRFSYPTDIDGWLKDFEVKFKPEVMVDETIIGSLLHNRFIHNPEIFSQRSFDIDQIQYHQSYPLDQIIAKLLKDSRNDTSTSNSNMIYQAGDMFDNPDNGVLFIPVNCKGSMGAGLALDAAERYPEIEEIYKKACKDGSLAIGKPLLTSSRDGKILLLFPTKNDWRNRSEIEYIESGIKYFNEQIITNFSIGQLPLHIPKLGCGLGGLDWGDVNPIIEKHFNTYQSKVYVYV